MATSRWTTARKVARWGLSTARQWRLKHSASTIASDVVEDSLFAAAARTFMAQVGAGMVTTLEWSTALTGTDMLRLNVDFRSWCRSTERSHLSLGSQPLNGLSFTSAASLTTLVSSAVQRSLAETHALGLLFGALMANGLEGVSATTAVDLDRYHAG
jgi:hypothetical protein